MHSLLRIANILNAKHKKIEKLTYDNMTSWDCDDKEVNKSKGKTLSRSMTFKI